MAEANFILETHFHGDLMDWLKQIPEEEIDKIISILGVDPNKPILPRGYSVENLKHLERYQTTKMCLWEDLVHTIHRWGLPTPTEMGTTSKELKNHLLNIEKKLTESKRVLLALTYEQILSKGTMSKEFIVGHDLRHSSEVQKSRQEKRAGNFVGAGYIADTIRENKEAKIYPLDYYITDAISALEKILDASHNLLQDSKYIPPKKGTKKKGKKNFDDLFWALCVIYKKYTNEIPNSYPLEDGTATGKIIPFLYATLSLSRYPYEITDWALEKKLRELKNIPEYKNIWTDGKK